MENKVFKLTLRGLKDYRFPYVKEGTIVFAKFEDGTIRKAKCVSNDFIRCYAKSDPNHFKLIQRWKVAGLPGLYYGYPDGTLHEFIYYGKVANLYVNEDNAQFASCSASQGDNVGDCVCDLHQLAEKYGLECGIHIKQHWGFETISIELWKINDVGETFKVRANFRLEYNHNLNRFVLVIPSMEEKMLFATEEDARANYKRKPVIDFDDEEETTEQQEEYVELSVKVKKSDVKRVKEFINDCIEFE